MRFPGKTWESTCRDMLIRSAGVECAQGVSLPQPLHMTTYENTAPAPPSPDRGVPPEKAPEGDPKREPERVPWHDPGPPVRKINLPPDAPSPAVPLPTPESPMIS